MVKQELLYEGKAKQVYATDREDLIVLKFKDDAIAYDGLKRATIENKGIINNQIMTIIYKYLEKNGVPTHYVDTINDREMICKKVNILKYDISVRNIVAGDMSKKFNIKEGTRLKKTVVEFKLRKGILGSALVNYTHLIGLDIAKEEEILRVRELTYKINELLVSFFKEINVDLVDYKLEFGRTMTGEIVLADEISPDTCRLWDKTTGKRLDIDRFRKDLGKVVEGYEEILRRVKTLA